MAASNWPLSSKLWQIYKFLIFVLVFVSRDLEHQLWRVNRQSCAGLIFLNTEEPLGIIVGLYRPHVFHVSEPTASEYWKNLCKLSPHICCWSTDLAVARCPKRQSPDSDVIRGLTSVFEQQSQFTPHLLFVKFIKPFKWVESHWWLENFN